MGEAPNRTLTRRLQDIFLGWLRPSSDRRAISVAVTCSWSIASHPHRSVRERDHQLDRIAAPELLLTL